jgi:polysaccharide biosynthesis transport protein
MDPFLEEQGESGGSGFDPMSLVRAFWRRRLLFIIPFVLCLTMAFIAIKTMTPIFASSGQVVVKVNSMRSQLLDDPRARYGGQYGDMNAIAYQEMNLLLTSEEFLDEVVRELNLAAALREDTRKGQHLDEETVIRRARNKLGSMIRLKSEGNRLYRLEVRDPDPAQAYRLAKFVLDRFVNEYRASQTATNTSTRDFLARQLEVYQADLQKAENELNSYQSGLASAALVDNPVNALNIGTADAALGALRLRFDGQDAGELRELSQTARGAIGELPPLSTYQGDAALLAAVSELEDLEYQSRLLPGGDRDSRDLETRLGQLRVRLRALVDTQVAMHQPTLGFLARNQVAEYVYFSLYRQALAEVIRRLDGNIREFRNFTARQPQQSTRVAEMQGNVTRARKLVESIEGEITQHDLNVQAGLSEIGVQIRVREEPQLEMHPVEPNKLKLMLMGVVLSLGIGVGLVVLAIMLDRSFNNVESMEKVLGVTVIGTLPMIQDEHFERRRTVRLLRWVTIILGILAVGAVGFLVIYPRLG